MTTSQRLLKATVDRHWSELMQAITQAQRDKALPENFPRDYIANTTWTDGWRDLLAREVADERRHRKFAPDGYRYTYGVTDAARLMILKFVAEGARLEAMPTALDCMTLRTAAVYAETLGFLLKGILPTVWVERAAQFDYVEAVRDTPREQRAS